VKVLVLVKQTPETAELPLISVDEARTGQVSVKTVINPWDEYAAEEAILLAERFNCDTVAVSVGSDQATEALKHTLAMGVDEALLVEHGAPADPWTIAALLAAAVREQGDVDLVLAGRLSVDANTGLVHVGVARKLGWSLLTNVVKIVELAGGTITVERIVDGAQETVQAPLPAVVSVGKEINEPRYPNFMGIRKASRAKIPVLTPDELGVDAGAQASTLSNLRKPAERTTTVQMIEGATPQEKAVKLVDALMAEKVI
jgi:electron transfer flavoprotein beta subunit